ncbi:hypothetical protein [Pseudomonas mediterranea]|uniref:hypothetical protein n=1 Tax=Pseudomonas mediterranea TaxID=183795 RepID=UPI000ADAB842|nr:hypothetical protein [Pseudomonas mediterranea]
MDIKKLTVYLRRNVVGILVVFTLYAGVAVALWGVHKDQEAESKRLAQERVVINDLKVAFETEKAASSLELGKRDLELQKREFQLGRAEADLTKQQLDIAMREKSLFESAQQLKTTQQTLSKEQQIADTKERIQKNISEFAELGVDLRSNYHCLDGDPLRRYNSARAKFMQIYSLVRANSLEAEYLDFLKQNMPKAWYGC